LLGPTPQKSIIHFDDEGRVAELDVVDPDPRMIIGVFEATAEAIIDGGVVVAIVVTAIED